MRLEFKDVKITASLDKGGLLLIIGTAALFFILGLIL
jgi:hypothetical protein